MTYLRHARNILMVALVFVVTFILWGFAGTIEGRFFPAAAPMILTHARMEGGQVVYSGSSARLRPGCSPLRLEPKLGRRGAQSTPVRYSWGKAIVRPNGAFLFDGWTINIDDLDTFRAASYSDVIHQCRIFYKMVDGEAVGGIPLPWETRTRFWN